MSEPNNDWPCKFDESPELSRSRVNSVSGRTINEAAGKVDNDFTFPSGPLGAEYDDEVTETKIRAFLVEKVLFSLMQVFYSRKKKRRELSVYHDINFHSASV